MPGTLQYAHCFVPIVLLHNNINLIRKHDYSHFVDMLLYSLSTPLTLISMWAVAMHNITIVGGEGTAEGEALCRKTLADSSLSYGAGILYTVHQNRSRIQN